MQAIRNLMRADLTALCGKRNSLLRLLLFIFLISALSAALVTPFLLTIILIVTAIMLPDHLSNMTAGSDRLYEIIPVTRKQFAGARFLLQESILTVTMLFDLLCTAVTYLFGLPGTTLARELSVLMSVSSEESAPDELFSAELLLIGLGFMIAVFLLACRIRKQLRTFGAENRRVKKYPLLRGIITVIVVEAALELLLMLILFGGRFSAALGIVISMVSGFIRTVSGLLHGAVLFVCMLTLGFCAAAYLYVCTYLEFEKKDI